MPPKAQAKADAAKKQKQVEDKTFGLKNKNKSKAVQKYVQQLQSTAQAKSRRDDSDPKEVQKRKKEEAAAREKELNELFKVAVAQPKVPVGVDPKSILCEFYRRGQCTKGFKCKFSHDFAVERKGEKIDLYSDQRDDEETMEDWDQEKLETVVATKGAEYANNNKSTEIVCKHFLEAVEKKQYGWFWACPNGGKACMYRHALPNGYVLKSQMKALLEEEAANRVTAEEEVERDRHNLQSSTPLTPELFFAWKQKVQKKRESERADSKADRLKNDKLSGRELFAADASIFVDDAEALDVYERREEQSWQPERPAASVGVQESDNRERQEGRPADAPSTSALPPDMDDILGESDEDLDDEFDAKELEELENSIRTTL